jgi:hypothetical protein
MNLIALRSSHVALNHSRTIYEKRCTVQVNTKLHNVSFRSPYLFCLLTVCVEVVYFHVITLRHTSHSVGLLWKRDRPVAETSTWQHTTLTRDKYPCPPVEFEPTIPASARQHTYALDRAATEIGHPVSVLMCCRLWPLGGIACPQEDWILLISSRFQMAEAHAIPQLFRVPFEEYEHRTRVLRYLLFA